jgi:multidrug efflux pump subunit AcrA (membrane-fusion protein)
MGLSGKEKNKLEAESKIQASAAAAGDGGAATDNSIPRTPPRRRRKKRAGRIIRRIIGFIILFAAIGGLGYYLFTLFKKPADQKSEALHEPVYRGSIQSKVTGSGITKAQESSSVTLTAGGEVLEVFVTEGQWVNKGDPLYIVDSEEAQKAVEKAEEDLKKVNEKINEINDFYEKLTIAAPFKGKLINAAEIEKGDVVALGTKIGTLVEDSVMKLNLYFSYGYEDLMYVGQAARVSIPSAMETLTGKISEIRKVERVSAEGTRLFEAVVTLENPGTLTEGMTASAAITADDGTVIYAYESSALKYNRSFDLVTEAQGNCISADLINYAVIEEGQVLLTLDSDVYDEQLLGYDKELETASTALEKAKESLENYQATAPMSGTVLSCALEVGKTAAAGTVAVNIADTSTMIVEAQIDEINIANVKPGMTCDIVQWGRDGEMHYTGVVDYVSLEADNTSGISVFPAKVTVQNPDGSLMSGMYVDYSLVAAQSDDCLIAPVQAVKYTESGTVVFVLTDTKPENALDAEGLGLEVPEGYYAVPVTIGLSDDYGVEITSGVEEGMEVFTQYMKTNANSMMGMG